MAGADHPYVSRGGLKLAAALDAFGIDPAGWVCADFGANVGGFTDCLLQRGACRVHAIDTGYGDLAWTLRKDPRVVVCERTNVLHAEVAEPVDLVVADLAWTPQARLAPAAAAWLGPHCRGGLVSLLKPHYELAKLDRRRPHKTLTEQQRREVAETVCGQLNDEGFCVRALAESPIRGKGGNREFLLWVRPKVDAGDKTPLES